MPPSPDPYAKDLARWMPRLIAVWRAAGARRQGGGKASGKRPARGARGGLPLPTSDVEAPPDRLLPHELREVAAGVRQLSRGLTRERELAGARYMDDPRLLGAYLLFYWPVSYAQARQALGELPHLPRRVLDMGSGPGPLALAALDAGAQQVIAADRSEPALQLARALATEAGEVLVTRAWDPTRTPLPDERFDLITMGHVLNELYGTGPDAVAKRAELVERICERLTDGGTLLILEPALRETSRALLEVRDLVVARGHAVRFPCLFRGACPALVKATDWCHADRPWATPPAVEAIAKAAGLHKDSLKMSVLALAPKGAPWPEPVEGRLFRIVSEQLEGKGRTRFMACGPEGRTGLAAQHRHRTDANAPFFHLQRGDVVAIERTEVRGDGMVLDATSSVRLVAPAGKRVPPRAG